MGEAIDNDDNRRENDTGTQIDFTHGSIPKGILLFSIPVFFGQLLQLFYNLADAWVIGNFASNEAFAAVSATGTIVFLVIGFFGGLSTGGSVIISRYYGAREMKSVSDAIHTCVALGILAAGVSTIIGLFAAPVLLNLLDTPDNVMPYARTYLTVYFAGVGTVVMFNICMAVMRALGDSLHPLYYLVLSSLLNIALDLLFVAHPAFRWGVFGAALATVISQGVSTIPCIVHMSKMQGECALTRRKLHINSGIAKEVFILGLPAGIQNIVIMMGNMAVQKNINAFGSNAMAGQGAASKIESFGFLPVTCMSMALPTFISQNLGAREFSRAKSGARFGIVFGVVIAGVAGMIFYVFAPSLVGIFVKESKSIELGASFGRVTSRFYFLLAFAHCAAGVMRGCGKSVVPMANMLIFWCVFRIIFVTYAVRIVPVFSTIAWSYPVTWGLSCIVFLYFLLFTDWVHNFEKSDETK